MIDNHILDAPDPPQVPTESFLDAPNPPQVPAENSLEERLEAAQEDIYNFFLLLMRQKTSEQVLMAFKHLFFEYNKANKNNFQVMQAVSRILIAGRKELFFATLKRCCYILVNNWEMTRQYAYARELVTSFERLALESSPSRLSHRLRLWMCEFAKTQNYRELKCYITRHENANNSHWSQRYISYFLVAESTDPNSLPEQQEAARTVSQYLKQQFKFDFAMYTARQGNQQISQEINRNPTALGNDALRIIKRLIAKQGLFDYSNLANIFLRQVEGESYFYFKACLLNYLTHSIQDSPASANLRKCFSEKLDSLYVEYEAKPVNDDLIMRTCNRIIENLTTEDREYPSNLFLNLMLQTNSLLYVLFLLKVVLISPHSRTFLEARIGVLIKYYMDNSEEDCQWMVNFFEIFNIAMSIHADKDVRYSLVKTEELAQADAQDDWDQYRIFSQKSEIPTDAISITDLLADIA